MNAPAMDAFSGRLPSRTEIENADHLRQIIASAIEDENYTINVVHEKGKPAEIDHSDAHDCPVSAALAAAYF